MDEIYLPDGSLNPDHIRIVRPSDEEVDELAAHLFATDRKRVHLAGAGDTVFTVTRAEPGGVVWLEPDDDGVPISARAADLTVVDDGTP